MKTLQNLQLKKLCNIPKEVNVAATNYGKESEEIAFECYVEQMKHIHEGFEASTTGLHINEKFPFLGASPDGLTKCSCCTEKLGLLEIKCPKSCEKKSLATYLIKKNGPFKDGQINKKHDYYFQMQMTVTERSFFVWTSVETTHVCVQRDETFCKQLETKLEKVFLQQILPELVTRNNDLNNVNCNKFYCYCKRPIFLPMIACDGTACKIEWFHYACVNLTRKPNGDTK